MSVSFATLDSAYEISSTEITVAQYAEFLTAVAKDDRYGLFALRRNSGILRQGLYGGYSYVVESTWGNRPIGYISRCNAARFVNWLANGQPIPRRAS